MELCGKVAIVTGGSRGIGLGIAEALLDTGCKVCISSVTEKTGEVALKQLQDKYGDQSVIYIRCDVQHNDQLRGMFKSTIDRFKRLDILVNNAGIVKESDWMAMINTNLVGVIAGTKLAIEHMDVNKGGHGGVIINVGSTSGILSGDFFPIYNTTKHALKGFTESFGISSGQRHGVRVNCIMPGWVKTGLYYTVNDPSTADVSHIDVVPMIQAHQNTDQTAGLVSSVKDVGVGTIQLIQDTTISGRCMVLLGDQKTLLEPLKSLDHLTFSPLSS